MIWCTFICSLFDKIFIFIVKDTRVSAAFGRQNPRLDGRDFTSPEDYQFRR